MKKRIASALLAVILTLGLVPMQEIALAVKVEGGGTQGGGGIGISGGDFSPINAQGFRIYVIDIYSDTRRNGNSPGEPYYPVEVLTTPVDILFSQPVGQFSDPYKMEYYFDTRYDKPSDFATKPQWVKDYPHDTNGHRTFIPKTMFTFDELVDMRIFDKNMMINNRPPTPSWHDGSQRIPQGDAIKQWFLGGAENAEAEATLNIQLEQTAQNVRDYYNRAYDDLMNTKGAVEQWARVDALILTNNLVLSVVGYYNKVYGGKSNPFTEACNAEYTDLYNGTTTLDGDVHGKKPKEHNETRYNTDSSKVNNYNLYKILNAKIDTNGNGVPDTPLMCWRNPNGKFRSLVNTTGERPQKINVGDSLAQIIINNDYRIIVEPIRWWSPHSSPTNYWYNKQVYGTVTNICDWALEMEGKPFTGVDCDSSANQVEMAGQTWHNDREPSNGEHYLYMYCDTFNKAGINSMIQEKAVSKNLTGGIADPDGDGKFTWVESSADSGIKTITNNNKPYTGQQTLEDCAISMYGLAMHNYYFQKPVDKIEKTHTYDQKAGKNPASAPVPPVVTITEKEIVPKINKDKPLLDKISEPDLRKTTIIKVYTDRQLDEDGGCTDTPHSTHVRQGNPDNILIEQEPDYRVDEWYDIKSNKLENKDMGNISDGSKIEPPFNWSELEGDLNRVFDGTEVVAGNPASGENVHLEIDPGAITSTKRVVYIHLIKTIKPVIEAKLTESQVSKVITTAENIDNKTEGLTGPWGSYTMDIHLDQLTPSSHQYTVHAGCSKKNCSDPCCDDYSSTCSAISRINGDNKISWTYGVQNAASKVVLEAPGTNFNNIVKSSTKVGNTIKFDETVDDGEYTRQFNSDSQASNGLVAYQTIWRGNQDNLTLANYKKQSMGATFDILNESSTITGKPVIPAKNSNPTPRKSNGKHAELLETSLLVTQADTLVIGRCLGGGQHHTIATVQQNATMTQELKFKVPITIYTYSGAIAGTAGTPSKASPALTAALTNKTATTNNKSQGRVDLSINQTQSPLTFNPYIRMSYRITEDGIDNSHVKHDKGLSERTAYILSDKQSSIIPNNGVEISWYNGTQLKNGYGLQLNSKQWSAHKKATEAPAKEKNPWQGKDKVLPGGALYELGTAGTESVVTSTTYSTFVDQTSRNWISVNDKNKYTIPSITAANNQYITEFRGNLENFRIVQQVTELNGKKSVEISAGNQETLQSGVKTSNDSKYLLTNGTGTNGIMEADLDIIKEVYQTTIYKCFTDTEGNVYLATASQGTNNKVITQQDTEKLAKSLESICGTNKGSAVRIGTKGQTAAQILAKQSPAIQSMNNKTGLISNVVNSVERNTGNDMKAAWVTDGHWYNEAYDGSYVIAQTIQYTVGLGVPNKRIAILDPALCPKSTGKGDIFTKAYTSQFKVSSKSTTAPAGTNPGYIGTFDTIPVEIPGIQNMFMSKTFSIPNATVQDLS